MEHLAVKTQLGMVFEFRLVFKFFMALMIKYNFGPLVLFCFFKDAIQTTESALSWPRVFTALETSPCDCVRGVPRLGSGSMGCLWVEVPGWASAVPPLCPGPLESAQWGYNTVFEERWG